MADGRELCPSVPPSLRICPSTTAVIPVSFTKTHPRAPMSTTHEHDHDHSPHPHPTPLPGSPRGHFAVSLTYLPLPRENLIPSTSHSSHLRSLLSHCLPPTTQPSFHQIFPHTDHPWHNLSQPVLSDLLTKTPRIPSRVAWLLRPHSPTKSHRESTGKPLVDHHRSRLLAFFLSLYLSGAIRLSHIVRVLRERPGGQTAVLLQLRIREITWRRLVRGSSSAHPSYLPRRTVLLTPAFFSAPAFLAARPSLSLFLSLRLFPVTSSPPKHVQTLSFPTASPSLHHNSR